MPSTAPIVSASGFSWHTASTWWARVSRPRNAAGTASSAKGRRSIVGVTAGRPVVCASYRAAGGTAPARRTTLGRRPAPGLLRRGIRALGRRLGVALVGQPLHGRGQGFVDRRDLLGLHSILQLVEQVEDTGRPLRRVVEVD